MPLFDFVCDKCGEKFEELVRDCNQAVVCPRCGGAARRNYSGKIYTSTGKQTGGCSGNCSTCSSKCK